MRDYMPKGSDIPEIPEVLRDKVKLLARSAILYRNSFNLVVSGTRISDVILHNSEVLTSANGVIQAWNDLFIHEEPEESVTEAI